MLIRTLSAETLKYRRTPALWLALLGPAGLAGLFALMHALNPVTLPAAQRWDWLAGNLFQTWAVLFLPLGTAILAALSTNLEHAENHLKHILTLPPPRWLVYSAKLIAVFGLVLSGSVVLGLSYVLVGVLIGASTPIPWDTAFRIPLTAFAALAPVLALGVWLGMRWRSFVVGLGVGLGGTVVGLIAMRSSTYWVFIPWAYPALATQPDTAKAIQALSLAALLGVLIILWGAFDFTRRDAP